MTSRRLPFTVVMAVPSSVAVSPGEVYIAWVYGHGGSLQAARDRAVREAREDFASEYGLTAVAASFCPVVMVLAGHHRDCLDSAGARKP